MKTHHSSSSSETTMAPLAFALVLRIVGAAVVVTASVVAMTMTGAALVPVVEISFATVSAISMTWD